MSKDELEEYLDALDRHDRYRVDALLKDSPIERTERVHFVGNNGAEQGPFIRKTIASESGQGRAYQKIFRAQQAGQRLAHIPHIHECYSTGASLEVIVEFVEGQTLQEYVEEHGPSRELAARLFPPLCDAVSELHEAFDPPIIHRDLTPGNIIVSDAGVTVIDLGIAREFHPGARRDTVYFGTRDFAPPEQFGFAQTDIRSDVYAMGKLLDYCLEGPASAGEELQVKAKDAQDGTDGEAHAAGGEREESPATEAAPDSPLGCRAAGASAPSDQVDRQIREVVATATNLDPEQRYASAAQLKAAFLAALVAPKPGQGSASKPVEVGESASVGELAAAPATPAAPATSATSATPAASDFRSRLSRVLGATWSAFVVLAWVLLLVISVQLAAEPQGTMTQLPLWARILEIYGIIFIPFTIVAYFLLDLRLLREKLPELRLPERRKIWPFALAIILILWALVYLIAYLTHL